MYAQMPEQAGPPVLGAPGINQPHDRDRDHSNDDWLNQQQREVAKKLNLQRQQALKRDSEKLLELATELKQYVDKTNEHILSLEVIRKADQIEKLAKSVREKMKGVN
jgi:hypothetical protein